MGILDKTIAAISPKWGAQRAKNRYVMNAYEAAMPNRTHKAKRESQGANVSTKQSAVSLREQARALDQNHDIVIGILDKLEERVIGSRGIHIEPQPLNLSGDVGLSGLGRGFCLKSCYNRYIWRTEYVKCKIVSSTSWENNV